MVFTPKEKEKESNKRGWWRKKIQLQLSFNFSQHGHRSKSPLLISFPINCFVLPRSTFLQCNFFADVLLISSPLVGNSKRKKKYISVLYFSKKKPQTFHSKNISLAYFLFYREKWAHFFFVDPQFSISKHPWGRGTAILWLFMSEHTKPRRSDISLFHFSPQCSRVAIYTFMLRSRARKKKLHSFFSLVPSVYPLRSAPRESCVPYPSF